jgi:uncharacterized integral membrane protein
MPKRILIIGILYCLFGISAIWDVISSLLDSRINLNFGVLLLLVGIGLFKGKPSSRSWAIFWIFLGYLACLIITVLALIYPQRATVNWFGDVIKGHEAFPYALAITAAMVAGLIVIHKLLNTEKALAYFDRNTNIYHDK